MGLRETVVSIGSSISLYNEYKVFDDSLCLSYDSCAQL